MKHYVVRVAEASADGATRNTSLEHRKCDCLRIYSLSTPNSDSRGAACKRATWLASVTADMLRELVSPSEMAARGSGWSGHALNAI